ncbi:MAG: hypothetical protein EP343_17725 [Deltaproteobacteria bacterium]|nr:MAG: hypothetical protein EP343_17725 [Deltaproteobacteria bacterium]
MTLKMTVWQQRVLNQQQKSMQSHLERSLSSCSPGVVWKPAEQESSLVAACVVEGQGEAKASRGQRFRQLLQQLQAFVEDVY